MEEINERRTLRVQKLVLTRKNSSLQKLTAVSQTTLTVETLSSFLEGIQSKFSSVQNLKS